MIGLTDALLILGALIWVRWLVRTTRAQQEEAERLRKLRAKYQLAAMSRRFLTELEQQEVGDERVAIAIKAERRKIELQQTRRHQRAVHHLHALEDAERRKMQEAVARAQRGDVPRRSEA